jgi:hypothetical protein
MDSAKPAPFPNSEFGLAQQFGCLCRCVPFLDDSLANERIEGAFDPPEAFVQIEEKLTVVHGLIDASKESSFDLVAENGPLGSRLFFAAVELQVRSRAHPLDQRSE